MISLRRPLLRAGLLYYEAKLRAGFQVMLRVCLAQACCRRATRDLILRLLCRYCFQTVITNHVLDALGDERDRDRDPRRMRTLPLAFS